MKTFKEFIGWDKVKKSERIEAISLAVIITAFSLAVMATALILS